MVNLYIHPEKKDFSKYLKLAKRNNFYIEVDIDILKAKVDFLKSMSFGVHGSRKLNLNKIIRELNFLSKFNISYVIYHDTIFLKRVKSSLKLLNNYDFIILLENYVIKDPQQFNKLYFKLKREIKKLKKCIDTGHVNISQDKKLKNWIDKDVEVIHLNNNFGQDTHNSIYNGEINFLGINSILKKSKYISLEVDRSYKTYLKNIKYMIKSGLTPFENIKVPLNHPIIQEEFILRVRKLLKKIFKDNLCYSFIYGSFARRTLHKKSDIDLMIILKSKTSEINFFHSNYKKLCTSYNIQLDIKYPFEVFLESDIDRYINRITQVIYPEKITDIMELLFAFLDKNVFITGKREDYLKHRRKIANKLLGITKINNQIHSKSKLKKIVKEYVLNL